MRRMIRLLWLILFLAPAAQAQSIILSAADDTPAIRRFTDSLSRLRPQDQVSFRTLDELRSEHSPGPLLITLDEQTLRWRLALENGPSTLAMRISRIEGQALLAGRSVAGVTLLWSDPPPLRQLRLVRQVMPKAQRVGLLYDGASAFLIEEYRQAAVSLGLELHTQPWSPDASRRPLHKLLDDSDLLLGIDAPRLYNADSIKTLLLTSYAKNRPLIGPTAAFVRAGSLASTYSSEQDWLAELVRWLDVPHEHWPASAYPQHFQVISNRQVGRALGLDIPSDSRLTRALAEGDGP